MTIEPHRIAGQFYNRPLLLTAQAAQTVSSVILSRFEAKRGVGGDDDSGKSFQAFNPTQGADGSIEIHSARTARFVGDYRSGPDNRPTPYRVTRDGSAIISAVGELVNRGAWIGASSGLVSYEGLGHQLSTAARDEQVSAIVIDEETPGGQAVGCFEIAALIRKIREVKPVIAIVNGMAASAGYAIASSATRIISIPSGISGSIGVLMMHLDLSEYLSKEGIFPTLIFAGDHKVDGNPFEPLPDSVRDRFKAEIDQVYSMFVQTVVAGRRGMTEQAIRATEARCFMGAEARRLGLVDTLGTLDDVIGALASPRSRSSLIGRSAMIASASVDTTASIEIPLLDLPTTDFAQIDTDSVIGRTECIDLIAAASAAGIDPLDALQSGLSAQAIRAQAHDDERQRGLASSITAPAAGAASVTSPARSPLILAAEAAAISQRSARYHDC